MEHQSAESQYVLVDQKPLAEGELHPLVIENARLYQLAEERLARLEKAQAELKVLHGIIPICAWCKKVRDDDGCWAQVEEYVAKHSEASFSHGICPSCDGANFPEGGNAARRKPTPKSD